MTKGEPFLTLLYCVGVESPPIRRSEWPNLMHAIDQDLEWVMVSDIYGDNHRIRVSEIATVSTGSAETMERCRQDRLRDG